MQISSDTQENFCLKKQLSSSKTRMYLGVWAKVYNNNIMASNIQKF